MGLIEQFASLQTDVQAIKAALGRHNRVPEQRWGTVTTLTSTRIGVTFPGDAGEQVIDRSTEAVWVGAQVLVQVQGSSRWIVGLGGAVLPAGVSATFDGILANLPAGWLVKDGSAKSRATYWRLYAALGGASSPHGQGDGSTTFNLPDAIDKMSVGAGNLYALGATGGEAAHALTTAEVGPHSHSLPGFTFKWGVPPGGNPVYANGAVVAAGNPPSNYLTTDQDSWNATNSAGAGTAHNNMPPYLAEIPIIKF